MIVPYSAHPSPTPVTLASASERRENVASVVALPPTAITGEARDALRCLARAGADMNIYHPAHSPAWRIWLRPLSPSWEGRMTLDEWTDVYTLASAYPTDSAAVVALSGRYVALLRAWEMALQAPAGDWRRPDGMTQVEQTLTYLYWRLLLASATPTAGRVRFLTLVASGDAGGDRGGDAA